MRNILVRGRSLLGTKAKDLEDVIKLNKRCKILTTDSVTLPTTAGIAAASKHLAMSVVGGNHVGTP